MEYAQYIRYSACVALLSMCLFAGGSAFADASQAAVRARPVEDDVIYFLLPDRFDNGDPSNDRGGLTGGPLNTGYDPTNKGFYHGGDLKGLMKRLDYIQALGANAVWITPVFKNKPVQGAPGHESAGYHGYWITDFTTVDPHLGSDADYAALVAALHARGIKIIEDIVANHTADVIAYRECPADGCPYRSLADYPYTRKGGITGTPINRGFIGDGPDGQTAANFARLTDPDYAYTPYIPEGEAHLKVPDWLNDPIYYHNRGESTFEGESSQLGDFGGLDDLMTENPRVVQGFIDIYGQWIDRFGIDGYRIDTERHVDPQFWQAFVPAILARAAADGIGNFSMFGEVATDHMDPALLALHTRIDHMPEVLDFAFAAAVGQTVAGTAGTDVLAKLFEDDGLYAPGVAERLPTFISNHDMGRFAYFVRKAFPKASDQEQLDRVRLGYAMLLTLRGVPVIYYGDEQGFAGLGGDQSARQDMFPSKVAEYNRESLVGTRSTTAQSNFNQNHPIFEEIRTLTKIRSQEPAFRGGHQVTRAAAKTPGLFAVSRFDPKTGREVLIAFNTSTHPIAAQVQIDARSGDFHALYGACPLQPSAPGSYAVALAPLSYVICAAGTRS